MLKKLEFYENWDFDKTKTMPFLIKEENLLGKCNKIWGEKVSNIIQKEFDRNPVELNLIMEKSTHCFTIKYQKKVLNTLACQ